MTGKTKERTDRIGEVGPLCFRPSRLYDYVQYFATSYFDDRPEFLNPLDSRLKSNSHAGPATLAFPLTLNRTRTAESNLLWRPSAQRHGLSEHALLRTVALPLRHHVPTMTINWPYRRSAVASSLLDLNRETHSETSSMPAAVGHAGKLRPLHAGYSANTG